MLIGRNRFLFRFVYFKRMEHRTLPLRLRKIPHVYIAEPTHSHTKKVNQYVMAKKLGQGANAKVYLAVDVRNKLSYAAKAIRLIGRDNSASTIEREIRIMRTLHHENIVKLYEVLHDTQNDIVYLIMEYADCGSLQHLIDSRIKFSDHDLASIFRQVLNGLIYLHEQGIVHQDIKPSNILLFSNGMVKITDFGIGHNFSSAEEVIGTPAYQAPEFFAESDDIELDPIKMDVYSLGVTLFQTATGELPFIGNTVYEITLAARSNSLIIPETVSPILADLLKHLLTPDPLKRPFPNEILQHPFFSNASDRVDCHLRPPPIPTLPSSASLDDISANVCDETYRFCTSNRFPFSI